MSLITSSDIAGLSPEERIALIGELWDSLDDADLALTAAQSAELAKRFGEFEAGQSQVVAWEDVKAELEKRYP